MATITPASNVSQSLSLVKPQKQSGATLLPPIKQKVRHSIKPASVSAETREENQRFDTANKKVESINRNQSEKSFKKRKGKKRRAKGEPLASSVVDMPQRKGDPSIMWRNEIE